MCGIAGLFSRDADATREELVSMMLAKLAHRGPDGSGVLSKDGATLGHRRLAIIDLAGGAQPIMSACGRVALVFNGEIYNFREQRRLLEARGHRFKTESDSEVLATAVAEWGTSCLPHLRGMFAFAAWHLESRTLLLVRDRLGKKPLYYAQRGEGLAFASDLPALLAWPAVERRLDPTAVFDFLRYGYVPHPLSLVSGVSKLPPASFLRFGADGSTRGPEPWWGFGYEPKLTNRARACAELESLLASAVADRLVSDVPVGSFLSSGIDSSLVSSIAARHTNLDTFTVGFDREPGVDERSSASRIAESIGARHHGKAVELDAVRALPRLVALSGEPLGDPSILPTAAVAEFARSEVKVVLTGDGGDETFAGYTRYAHSRVGAVWSRLPRSLRTPVAAVLARSGVSPHRLAQAQRNADRGPAETYASGMRTFEASSALALLGRSHRAAVQGMDKDRIAALIDQAPARQWLDRLLYADLRSYLADGVLAKVDRMTMAFGVEARSPLLDHRLVEFSARLPSEWKRPRGSTGKAILRDVAARHLPAWVIALPKKGFNIPLQSWVSAGPLRQQIDEALGASLLVRDGWLDPEALAGCYRPNDSGLAPLGNRLWSLYTLELWYRAHIGT